MKNLLDWIAASLFPANPACPTEQGSGNGADDTIDRDDRYWDEALICAMYDENARSFLDYMGPRAR
ncbi:hypothetical protein ACFQ3C_04160 [Seohaeicola saemankumensis]|uniref:Uncharacterized protein n=1 Tax=Seohaeicola saemankumensis TaxID=481181 RepID=A0ABW3TC74_9RHOB